MSTQNETKHVEAGIKNITSRAPPGVVGSPALLSVYAILTLSLVLITTMTATAIFGQSTNASLGNPDANPVPPPSAPAERSKAEIEKLVAPIALYPDPLLAILLPASAYPLEIVQAARFVKNTNNIAKLDSQPWDENVKALARFPDVIATMDTNIAWTSELGQAFVQDQKSVMDAIQAMRGKAQQAGSLKTSPQQVVATTNEVVETIVEQQVVYVTNTVVQIQPAQPQVIYVPQYNPSVVYAPAPAYAYDPVAPLVTFGVGMAVGAAIANNCDWHSGGVYVGRHGAVAWGGGYHGDVDVNVNQNVNVNRSANVNQTRNTTVNGQKWQPDASRRTSTSTAATPEARGWGGGQASQNAAAARSQASDNASAARAQASENAAAARSQASQNAAAARSQASERGSAARAQASENAAAARGQASANASAAREQASANAAAARAQASQRASAARAQGAAPSYSSSTSGRVSGGGGSAFNNSGGGAQARQASARGSASRGSFGGGGGGRRR